MEIRCTCSRQPLLAVVGRDSKTNQPFIHVKTWKGGRLYAEVVVESGKVRLHCRECFRWLTVTIRHLSIESKSERLPDSIAV
jgi:hypothetical protein